MDQTLDTLPGEGESATFIETRCRHECDTCGEPAHYKHTYLLPNARANPNSKAFRKDDCSWCEDARRFVCKAHQNDRTPPDGGYEYCSTFPASDRFAHMFLYWHKQRVEQPTT